MVIDPANLTAPELRGKIVEAPPITADEVAAIWREATGQKPYPSEDKCKEIAEILTYHRHHGAAEYVTYIQNRRAIKAGQLLLKTFDEWLNHLQGFDGTPPNLILDTDRYNKLSRFSQHTECKLALEAAITALDPRRRSTKASEWEACASLVWLIARNALTELKRTAGRTENAVAVRFAVRATERMGFPKAKDKEEAFAKHLARQEKRQALVL
jgi:hypothetical protein